MGIDKPDGMALSLHIIIGQTKSDSALRDSLNTTEVNGWVCQESASSFTEAWLIVSAIIRKQDALGEMGNLPTAFCVSGF
jgi:hypothetical protein